MAVTREQLESLTVSGAAEQWRRILRRDPPVKGKRQPNFLPVEQVLSFASLFVVDPSSQGGGDWSRYHPELRRIGAAVRRSPASIANKGMNLRGTRAHGQKHEEELYAALGSGDLPFTALYLTVLAGAREAGVGEEVLPDFLGLVGAADPARSLFLGDEELAGEDLEREATLLVEYEGNEPDPSTVATRMADMRLGQSRFAREVLDNFANHCGFCGLDGRPLAGHRLTVASHIKPWRDASHKERLDPRNGVAACPTHDAAFDTGLLTIRDDGTLRTAGKLNEATSHDPAAATAFAVKPRLQLPPASPEPKKAYLRWHRSHIWVNHAIDP